MKTLQMFWWIGVIIALIIGSMVAGGTIAITLELYRPLQNQAIESKIEELQEMIEYQDDMLKDSDHVRILYRMNEEAPKCKE